MGAKPGHPLVLKLLERMAEVSEPLPPREDVECGLENPYLRIPPEGDRIFLSVSWEGAEGRVTLPIEELIVAISIGVVPSPAVG